jgi:hypothetical protein
LNNVEVRPIKEALASAVFEQAAKSCILVMAEEEGFDSVQYAGGTCWHALVRYSRETENKEFTFCRINTGFPPLLIEPLFVANLA